MGTNASQRPGEQVDGGDGDEAGASRGDELIWDNVTDWLPPGSRAFDDSINENFLEVPASRAQIHRRNRCWSTRLTCLASRYGWASTPSRRSSLSTSGMSSKPAMNHRMPILRLRRLPCHLPAAAIEPPTSSMGQVFGALMQEIAALKASGNDRFFYTNKLASGHDTNAGSGADRRGPLRRRGKRKRRGTLWTVPAFELKDDTTGPFHPLQDDFLQMVDAGVDVRLLVWANPFLVNFEQAASKVMQYWAINVHSLAGAGVKKQIPNASSGGAEHLGAYPRRNAPEDGRLRRQHGLSCIRVGNRLRG